MDNALVGVFDSGIGGLTVVSEMRHLLPEMPLIYIADQAHVPYGGRPLDQVRSLACRISDSLIFAGCGSLVFACNISTATALEAVAITYPDLAVVGMIAPGAQAAAAQTKNGRIGVLATAGTVRSGAYTQALCTLDSRLRVLEIACPAFVPFIEAGEMRSPALLAAAHDALAPLLAARVDTIVLGCTHYPFLLPILRELAPGISWINPAEQVVRLLAASRSGQGGQGEDKKIRRQADKSKDRNAVSFMQDAKFNFQEQTPPVRLLLTTGDVAAFATQVETLLPELAASAHFGPAFWQGNRLHIAPVLK